MDQIDFNKLWRNFTDTVSNHYMDFSGRVARAQFWYYILVSVVVALGVSIVGGIFHLGDLLSTAYMLLLLMPNVGMTARRLQDTGKPGTWAWLLAVPVAMSVLWTVYWGLTILTLGFGLIFLPFMTLLELIALAAVVVLIYFCAQPGEAGSNAYGPVPPVWTPGGASKPASPA